MLFCVHSCKKCIIITFPCINILIVTRQVVSSFGCSMSILCWVCEGNSEKKKSNMLETQRRTNEKYRYVIIFEVIFVRFDMYFFRGFSFPPTSNFRDDTFKMQFWVPWSSFRSYVVVFWVVDCSIKRKIGAVVIGCFTRRLFSVTKFVGNVENSTNLLIFFLPNYIIWCHCSIKWYTIWITYLLAYRFS